MFHTSIAPRKKLSGFSPGWYIQDNARILDVFSLSPHISLISYFQSSEIPTLRRYSRNCSIALLDCERLMTL